MQRSNPKIRYEWPCKKTNICDVYLLSVESTRFTGYRKLVVLLSFLFIAENILCIAYMQAFWLTNYNFDLFNFVQIFFIMRKKFSHVTFLHVYHHTGKYFSIDFFSLFWFRFVSFRNKYMWIVFFILQVWYLGSM